MAKESYWIGMAKVDNEFYVLAGDNGRNINDFGSEKTALKFFTDGYDRAHLRGAGTAALVSFATADPRVLKADIGMLTNELFDFEAGVRPVQFGANLGFQYGWKCNGALEAVEKAYNSGKTPEPLSKFAKSMLQT